MSSATIEATAATNRPLNPQQQAMLGQLKSWFLFKLFAFRELPLGFISGMAIKEFNRHKCITTVPYGWLTRNPFKSTYFAALAMAAELSNGSLALLAVKGHEPSVAVIITGLQADFIKRATDVTTFTCEGGDLLFDAVKRAAETGEPVEQPISTVGRMPDGTVVAKFTFTWSFKSRGK